MKFSTKNLFLTILGSAFAVAIPTATSHAAVIFTDTFDSGTGIWYKAGTENTLANSAGQLSWTQTVTTGVPEVIGRAMAAQTLAVGQTIRLTFDYTQTGTTNADILRVGFYNVDTTPAADGWSTTGTLVGAFSGYTTFVRDNLATGNVARFDSATDTTALNTGPTVSGTAITTPANTQNLDIVLNTQYQAVFDVTLTSASQVNTLFTLSNGFSVAGQTSTVYNGFDTVVLRTANSALFDNVQVEVIPEPSTALLGGLGLLMLLRRRRR